MKRALLVEYNLGTAEALMQMLAYPGLGGCEVVHVEQLADALKKLKQQQFDVALVDLHLPDSWGLDTFLKMHTEFPDLPIILLAAVDDENIARRAMEAGAEDYLLKANLETSVLQHCIGRATHRGRAKQSKQGTIIGVLGVKGGVGTTTVALNLATHIVGQEKTVALLELGHPFGGLGVGLHHTPANNLTALLSEEPAAINEAILSKELYSTAFGLRVIFGAQRADEARLVMDAPHAETIVWTAANSVDCTVLDLGSHCGPGTDAAIKLCSYVVIVLERDMASLAAAHMALERLNLLGMSSMQIGAVVVNRAEVSVSVDLREIQTKLNCEILGVVPLSSHACFRAVAAGEPLIMHEPENPAALSLTEIGAKIGAKNMLWRTPVPIAGGPASAPRKQQPKAVTNGGKEPLLRRFFSNTR
ncbi:MAG: response regulator [Verrucomicrobia bacterium]|nr:response regulator [Verrucomicrobiota bacterium]